MRRKKKQTQITCFPLACVHRFSINSYMYSIIIFVLVGLMSSLIVKYKCGLIVPMASG